MTDQYNFSKAECFSALNATVRYAENHFKTEEDYFQKYGYPKFLEHNKEHEGFVEEIFSMVDGLEEGTLTLAGITMHLKDWFSDHLLNTDQQYKEFFAEKLGKDDNEIIRIDLDGTDCS
jgi:hemerythrin-like metal-binding protein